MKLKACTKDSYDSWRMQAEAALIGNKICRYIRGKLGPQGLKVEVMHLVRNQMTYEMWTTQDCKVKLS